MTENWSKSNYLSKFSRKFIINLQKQTLLLLLLLTSKCLLIIRTHHRPSSRWVTLMISATTFRSLNISKIVSQGSVLNVLAGDSIPSTSPWSALMWARKTYNNTTPNKVPTWICLSGVFLLPQVGKGGMIRTSLGASIIEQLPSWNCTNTTAKMVNSVSARVNKIPANPGRLSPSNINNGERILLTPTGYPLVSTTSRVSSMTQKPLRLRLSKLAKVRQTRIWMGLLLRREEPRSPRGNPSSLSSRRCSRLAAPL